MIIKKIFKADGDLWIEIYNYLVVITFVMFLFGGIIFAYIDATNTILRIENDVIYKLHGVFELKSGFIVWFIWILITGFYSFFYLFFQKVIVSHLANVRTIKKTLIASTLTNNDQFQKQMMNNEDLKQNLKTLLDMEVIDRTDYGNQLAFFNSLEGK